MTSSICPAVLTGSARIVAVAAFTIVAALPGAARAQVAASWSSAIANLQTPNASGQTVRQFARISIGGNRFSVRISNETGTQPLTVADAHVALPGSAPGSIDPASDHVVMFNGGTTIVVAPGAGVISDPVDMPVQPLTKLAVSAFFQTRSPIQVGHLLASETNYLAPGRHGGETAMAGATSSESGFYLAGLSIVGASQPAGIVACLGDSITDGLYSTIGGEHRYPDRLAERLVRASAGRLGAINAGILGNGLLGGAPYGLGGASALARLSRDVLTRPGVRWMILFEGINDIIYPPDTGDTAAELVSAYRQVIDQAHEHAVKVFGATLTPFRGSGPAYYSDAKEQVRQRVNAWIRGSGAFDAVFDFDAIVRDPAEPNRLRPAYDADHLHFNDAGYAAIADSIPLSVMH